ncbi:hypothetical protein TWF173_006612 [Orbilia oligospora]|uniref:HIT-type domain-containing protein n=1 Tax=Orbilia oligospora TaxID=2813651 RepID=A0A4Z0XIH6_ORBOL|nr:hypothetical protein TWF751_002669 [Orbilia oligospora]KAF3189198.1 hypothetical protein TWF225_002956 [Orbilia oligospora]KAF3197796.1 hypothetical protein TWF679_002631 [Orbilia oligospora]KAF3204643.1 hypothetical protein TWF191_002206 [Orbilia oligospora]KAF3217580.1 hypothetical protein TWF106_007888 [Orbilia oligospora]
MAPSLGICKFCEKEQAKYKCPNCAAPYCGLVCYKPHKAKHDEEKESQSTAAAEASSVAAPEQSSNSDSQVVDTSMDMSTTSAPTSVPQLSSSDTPQKSSSASDFDSLLANGPLIHAMRNNQNLKARLLDIYNSTQKAAFEAENARLVAQNAQFSRRGRGRGGRRGFFRQPQDWTVERGMNRGLRKIQAMRKGGKDENVDIEEWSRAVLSILEGDS